MENNNIKGWFDDARREVLEKWNRVVPSNELLFDRWEKAEFAGAGKGSSIYDSCLILGDVSIGEDTWIGPNSVLDGSGGLKIGKKCTVGACTQIYSHDGAKNTLSEGKAKLEYAATEIGDFVHVSVNITIHMGVTIGHHSVVCAGCVVTKSFPPYSIIAGVPARRIGRVEIDENKKVEFIFGTDE